MNPTRCLQWLTVVMTMALAMLQSGVARANLDAANRSMEEAHLAFERGAFREAMRIYEGVAVAGHEPARVWTNAGTAAWRAGERGRAVLFYCRAIKADPEHTPALRSLDVVSPATNTDGDEASNAVELFFRTLPTWLFVAAAQVLFLVACVAIWRMMATGDREQRGHWFAVLGWSLAFVAMFGATAWYSHGLRTTEDRVVVLDDGAVTYSEPNKSAVAELELPAGTILQVVDEPRGGFYRVRTRDGRGGFIRAEEVERI